MLTRRLFMPLAALLPLARPGKAVAKAPAPPPAPPPMPHRLSQAEPFTIHVCSTVSHEVITAKVRVNPKDSA